MLGQDIWGPPSAEAAAEFETFSLRYPLAHFETAERPPMLKGSAIADAILAKRDQRQPASFIRISDGEGNLIPLAKDIVMGEALTTYCLRRISYIHFGDYNIIPDNRDFFGQMLQKAIAASDLMGLPEIGTIRAGFETPDSKKDVRAICGNRCSYLSKKIQSSGEHIGDAWFSRGLLPHYETILSGERKIGLISVYPELGDKLQAAFGIGEIDFIQVPIQAVFVQTGDRKDTGHYPKEMDRISAQIAPSFEGMIFLVAAGLLGKHYATLIQARGGIAIDIGSVAEIWLGIEARGLSADYINRWKL